MFYLARPRRPRRAGEWTPARAVTFIVTLAASRSVTLAARECGMSRKSAYALRGRDPVFASAWRAALKAPAAAAGAARQGDETHEARNPPISNRQGDGLSARNDLPWNVMLRDRFFAGLAAERCDSEAAAPRRPLARPGTVA